MLAVLMPVAFFFYYFDPRYFIFVGPAILLAIVAQMWVKGAMAKWSRVPIRAGLTGRQVAERVLNLGGVSGVAIQETRGWLSDHYDPRHQALRLSPQVHNSTSVAACAVAAHEAGHAIQHARRYAMLQLRSAYVPAASIGSWLSIPLIFLGFIFTMPALTTLGVIFFSAVVLFQLITLPVEFDASRRAKKVLAEGGLVADAEEARGVSAVLTAAAMTYVAATLQAISTLLYYLYILGFFGRRS
ncbi:MAG: zinc metallopeptidase [Planctomycetota bacterium]